MGFYIRKSFRAGPVRLNLSKSGLGVSTGVKGLRFGSGPRGNYIHAGRGGLYYRQNLSSNSYKKYGSTNQDSSGLLGIVAGIIAIFLLLLIVSWLIENPIVFVLLVSIAVIAGGFIFYKKRLRSRAMAEYKKALDEIFVLGTKEFNKLKLADIKKELIDSDCKPKLEKIEKDIYRAVLDKIIDDNAITPIERESIQNLESIISISDAHKNETKLEIFTSYYLNAIEDRLLTNLEIDAIHSISKGLGIDQSDIQKEMQTVDEIIRMQALKYPLPDLDTVPITIQKSETAFYSSIGKILSRKKAPKYSNSEYEYSVRRDGNLVITNKRILIVKEGTTSINISDILDIDVDIDNKFILISRGSSTAPIIIQTDEALICGKIIDILRNNMT